MSVPHLPTIPIIDYEEIDLPVFTCSSRDYVRLKSERPESLVP